MPFMPLSVINRTRHRVPRGLFLHLFAAAKALLPGLAGSKAVCLVFIDEKESGKLNQRYRGRAGATNVLSFKSLIKGELGDILICPAIAKREARGAGIRADEWLGGLFVHGLLHLLGFSHSTKKEEKRMEKYAQKIINRGHA